VDQQESIPQHVAERCERRSRVRTRASHGRSTTAGIDGGGRRIPSDDAFLDRHCTRRADEAKTQANESSLKHAGVNPTGMRGLRLD